MLVKLARIFDTSVEEVVRLEDADRAEAPPVSCRCAARWVLSEAAQNGAAFRQEDHRHLLERVAAPR